MGFGQLFTVESAGSQANHSHVPDSGMSIRNTGQNLFMKKTFFSSNLSTETRRKTKASICSEIRVLESVAIPVRTSERLWWDQFCSSCSSASVVLHTLSDILGEFLGHSRKKKKKKTFLKSP